jgi:hypothetical protein
MAENCGTCRYKSASPYINPDRGSAEFAKTMFACRRNAPVVTGGLYCATMTVWPMVSNDDWCGKHSASPKPCEHGTDPMDCPICQPF